MKLRHKLVLSALLLSVMLATPPAKTPAAPPAKLQADPTIRTSPGHAMVPVGGHVEFDVKLLDAAGQPIAGRLTARRDAKTAAAEPVDLPVSPENPGKYRFSAEGLQVGIHTVDFSHAGSPAKHTLYVDVVDQETYKIFEEAAGQIEWKTLPVHLLFLGDSLTDLFRGQNYVDKVAFWLAKRYGSQATVRNAGVGGDYIVRVWERLNGDPKSYRLEMYQELYQPKPTHVFFFLGHNDSKLSSSSGYTEPVVAPEQFSTLYRQAIRKVRQETGARIVVISATSSVYEITAATAEKSRARDKPHNLFGKPEVLEQFNAQARQAAQDCGADWLDVYEPTRRHPDKPSLFTADGVHVSHLGNRLLALEILKYLGSGGTSKD